ncbi:MAG TPA: hypothetical protein VGP35_13390 [Terriglobales bacterium]|jgi:lipopolysaccharide export LptBFGC system permease protein LptF|nr:hypothetical protein [Terriglobales bacterium]
MSFSICGNAGQGDATVSYTGTSSPHVPDALDLVVCYKKKVRTFFENLVLPLCAGIIIFILAIPYFHHHLMSLGITLISILVFGLILSLWIQKSKKAEAEALNDKIAFLQRIYETDQLNRDKIAAESTLRKARREQLSIFLTRGDEIRKGIVYNNPQSFADKESWEKEVSEYLAKNWEPSSVRRFQSPNQATDFSNQSSKKQDVAIGEMQARMSILHDFISALQD